MSREKDLLSLSANSNQLLQVEGTGNSPISSSRSGSQLNKQEKTTSYNSQSSIKKHSYKIDETRLVFIFRRHLLCTLLLQLHQISMYNIYMFVIGTIIAK